MWYYISRGNSFIKEVSLINKEFKNLNLNSSFLFAAVFENPENCKIMLELLLGKNIDKITVKSESPMLISSDIKCIRLDVHAIDTYNVNYDIEAQNYESKDLPRRSRYYQAEMDIASLKPGETYDKLGDSYIIFICTFDPFGRGLCKYTYEEICREDGYALADGAKRIFFNTSGNDLKNISDETIQFLKYFENTTDEYVSSIDSSLIHKLHKKVSELKQSRELEAGYMKFEELINRTMEKGRAEGLMSAKKYILEILERLGSVPEDVIRLVMEENNSEILDRWFRFSIESKTIKEFLNKFNDSEI